MDQVNSEDMVPEWTTPNSSEFESLENNCVKRLEFEATDEIINRVDNLEIGTNKCSNTNGDGNDSGVDAGITNSNQLQRALSSNSAGYASSSGGLDAQFASCNSSLLSVCSDSNDGKTTVLSCKGSVDCTSENGSESSSLSGDKQRLKQTPPKKRAVIDCNQSKSPRNSDFCSNKNQLRAVSANRTTTTSHRNYGAPVLATTERARSRNKQITPNSQSSPTRRAKPCTLPGCKDSPPLQQKCSTLKRAASVSKRTPSVTPSTEDGRWPSNQLRSASKVQHRNLNESLVIKTKVGPIVLDNKFDKFSSILRRNKFKSEEDLSEWRAIRSSSTARDRMSSSTIVRRLSTRESPNKAASPYPPRYQKPASKTLIYHEASIQTALTSQDIDDAFVGNPKEVQIGAVLKIHRESQVDIRDKEIEELKEKIKAITVENETLRQNLVERSQLLASMESQFSIQLARERDEKTAMKKELQSNTERVLGMLELVHTTSTTESDDACDSLLMLESQIQLSGHVLEEKQSEINTLRQFCSQLQVEMNRSMQVQQCLLEEKKCFEKETSELQDFLQDEKAAIFEALKDAESEIEQYEVKLSQKKQDVERLQDECRHLVRISEQRRQEFLGMQTKYAALESKCKMIVVRQNQAASGATFALSDLCTRLNDLVEQLVICYNISEQELEDEIYHNETYTNSNESSPESETKSIIHGSTPPQRHNSFISAVINAIKSAANTAKDKVHHRVVSLNSIGDVTEMLDSETEPCLMMENVLEDVSVPDAHSQNLISSLTLPPLHAVDDNQEDSLHNLCEAIANRQKIEEQTTLMMMNQSINSDRDVSDNEAMTNTSICEGFHFQILVEQVINVDNLITKLLKILRIIQIDSDNCIQQLIDEKNSLKLKMNLKLTNNLEKTKTQLISKCNDLTSNHTVLKMSRHEINKLNEDICKISTMKPDQAVSKNEEHSLLILSTHKEMPIDLENVNSIGIDAVQFKSETNGTDQHLISQANGSDTKSQNDTITKAIETLNDIQSIVRQYPVLIDLQRDLEQMLILPSDCNANCE